MTTIAESLGVLGDPAQRQEWVLRRALEARREAWTRGGLYLGGADLLLRHGQFFSGAYRPDEFDCLEGERGRCFENALAAVRQQSTLRYFEGVYAIGSEHYTPHAWCVTQSDRLIEVTLPAKPETVAGGKTPDGFDVLPVEHWGYWGAEFHPDFVEAVWDLTPGLVGILDRPTQDGFNGLADEPGRDFPQLRVPYDKNRRSL